MDHSLIPYVKRTSQLNDSTHQTKLTVWPLTTNRKFEGPNKSQ